MESLSFGVWLRRRRRALDVTQAELARRVGYAESTIRRIEADELRPSKELATRLAEPLELAPEERDAFVRFARGGGRVPDLPTLARAEPTHGVAPRDNLLAQLTSFIGRERELAEITDCLADGVRVHLLTLTGTGGCGKTRLALQGGAALVPFYPDGVWLVELASLGDPDLVAPTVAAMLGIQNPANRPILAHLVDALGARRLLLLLDNCEHLVDACARLADAILRGCPNVQILATSREALRIAGETSRRVPSLGIPPGDELPPLPDLEQIDAVRLFIDRARAVRTSFALTVQNAAAVAQICRRLDGIPLALELAAARLHGLSVEQLASRLDQRFRLLTGGSRAALPRQQTLAAAVAWSYDLLDEAERTLFRRLAVFAGGFTLEAAEAVGGDPPLVPTDILDLLLRLVEKSLVVAEPGDDGSERYRLLETLRQYAREKLRGTGEGETVARRHASFYLTFATEAEPALHGSEQAVWLDRIGREHDNLRAAIAWLVANGQWVDALRLAGGISWFWVVRGYYAEGQARLGALVARPEVGDQAMLRAEGYAALGYLAQRQGARTDAQRFAEAAYRAASAGDNARLLARAAVLLLLCWEPRTSADGLALADEALTRCRAAGLRAETGWLLAAAAQLGESSNPDERESQLGEALAILREVGDLWWLRRALQTQCVRALIGGDYSRTRSLASEFGQIARVLKDRSAVANALMYHGDASLAEGDFGAAVQPFLDARTIYEDVADRTGNSWANADLAATYLGLGDVEVAQSLVERGLAAARQCASPGLVAQALRVGADVALARDDLEVADSHLREGVPLFPGMIPDYLDGFARLAMAHNAPARTLRLAAAASAQRARIGLKSQPIDQTRLAAVLERAERVLNEEARATTYAEGQAMTLEQAVSYALEDSALPDERTV